MVCNAKTAIVDLGFVDGYIRNGPWPQDDMLFDYLLGVFERMEEYATNGVLLTGKPDAKSHARFLHDIAFVRGYLWPRSIPCAVSEAMGRIINFATDVEHARTLHQGRNGAESVEDMLSDEQRDKILDAPVTEEDCASREFAESIGASHRGVLEHWWNLGAIDRNEVEADLKESTAKAESGATVPAASQEPAEAGTADKAAVDEKVAGSEGVGAQQPQPAFNPNGKRGRREWTPEQRAVQAERAREYAKNKPPLVPDEAFGSMKADFDAGLSMDAIGRKYGCSGGHIRNFLKKHGVDPRRTKAEMPAYEAAPREEYEWKEVDKQRVIQMRCEGVGWRRIGEVMGRTGSSCSAMYHHYLGNHPEIEVKAQTKEEFNAAVSAGLTEAWAKKARKITEDDIETIREMVAAGTSMNAIGDHFDCGHQSVIHFCKKHGIRAATSLVGKVPENDGAKIETQAITQEDIAEVQEMLDKDDSYEAIGNWFGCDAEAVHSFCEKNRLIPSNLKEQAKAKYEARQAAVAVRVATTNDVTAEDAADVEVEPEGEEPALTMPTGRPIAASRHPEPAHPLAASDWPDVCDMLDEGRSLRAIAGDFEDTVSYLERFIAIHRELDEGEPPPLGKPPAPHEPLAVGAN